MERQVRWRPAWFADVEKDGQILPLHLRGDREGDVAIFPDLKREADVISRLGEQGVFVPRIYGYCEDPPCIVMDALAGSRDLAAAPSDEARRSIGREYMAQVAAMHRLPLDRFVEMGLDAPEGAEAIALVGLRAYLPLYRRTKSRPEPMLEFIIGWIRRNVPRHRTRASFIQFDSGQFLHEDGKLSGLYDFEFSMIGDPLVDIATMRMRDSNEPLGSELKSLLQDYEEFTGEPVDHEVVNFHTLLFSTLGAMQFTGTVGAGTPGDPHDTYLEWDLALRQKILEQACVMMGIVRVPEPPPTQRVGDNAALIAKLADTVARIEAASPLQESHKTSASRMLEWLGRSDAVGAEMRGRDMADVAALLGRPFAEWSEAMAALEAYVQQPPPEADEALLRLFGRMEARRMHMFSETRMGRAAVKAVLTPTR
jgi:aminoglycoside phosphotransferase (APT) family kinase protein